MHSEPSKAAMERVDVLFKEWGSHGYRIGLARYIDTVDCVAREVKAGIPGAISLHPLLYDLMLPDEPDANAVNTLIHEVGGLMRNDPSKPWFEHLKVAAAAGYIITKDGCDEIQ